MSCYLTFDASSQGTLFVVWSESEVEGALASFSAGKTVPKFKFTSNGGRSELVREMSGGTGERMKRYYGGWASFIKLAKQFNGTLTLYNFGALPVVDIFLLDGTKSEHNVSQLLADTPTPINTYVAVGVVPHPNPAFTATTMNSGYFISVGHREGVGLTI